MQQLVSAYNSLALQDRNFFQNLPEDIYLICTKLSDLELVSKLRVDEIEKVEKYVKAVKEKKVVPGQSSISKEASEAIYKKFHPQEEEATSPVLDLSPRVRHEIKIPAGSPLKMSPEEVAKVEAKMRLGKSAVVGFLGPNESLIACCQKDLGTLSELGITYKQIGDRLEGLVNRAWRLITESEDYNSPVSLDWKFKLSLRHVGGYESCFPCEINDFPFDIVLENIQSKKQLKFPGLVIPLIRNYGFFAGYTPHRLDPREVCSVLELKSGEDYTPKTVTIDSCKETRHYGTPDEISRIMDRWELIAKQQLSPNTFAYLVKDPYADTKFRFEGRTYPAKLYLYNPKGEKVQSPENIFGIDVSEINGYHRLKDTNLLEFRIEKKQKYVLGEYDKVLEDEERHPFRS